MEERRILEALLGTYVAVLLIPAAALLSGRAIGPARIAPLVGAGVAAALAVALVARAVDDLADVLASLPVAAASVLPPLGYLLVLATAPASREALVAVVGLLAVLPGIAVPAGGATVRNRRLRRAATEVAAVTVGGESEGTNWPLVAGAAVMGVGFIAMGAVVALGDDASIGSIAPALGGLSTSVFLLADDETEVAVTDVGLRVDRSITPWAGIEGYRVTEDAVEIVRTRRYLPDPSFDRDAIDDEAALREALAEFLPRLDEHGRVEAAPRR